MILKRPALLLSGLILLNCSCGAPAEQVVRTPDLTTWKLAHISGLATDISGLYPNHRPTLTFDNETGKLYVDTGCNRMTFAFTSTGNGLRIRDEENRDHSPCPGPAEPHFLYQLKAVDSFSVSKNGLFLYGRDLPLMHLKAL